MPLNITEQNTLELIAARSKYNPITAKEIGERLKLSKRAVAEVVERLVNKWGIVIVGARQGANRAIISLGMRKKDSKGFFLLLVRPRSNYSALRCWRPPTLTDTNNT